MATFSNTPYEADQLSNLYDILQKLPNNTANLIKPKDIRDGVYTIWQNILFKITGVTGSTYSYFGIDNDSYRTKFFLGKKTLSGSPIMSNLLLTSDSDYYIYNNKSDSNPSLQNTKISFLAGPSASDYDYAPYLQAKKITTPSRIDLELINPATSGVITIGSTVNSVSIAGVLFPPGVSASIGNSLIYTSTNQLSWAATPVLLASSPFIPMVGTGGGLYDSHLKQTGNSIQIVNGKYLSDPSGLIRMNFMTGSGIELSTDGGALTTPNIIIDSNKVKLSSSFGSININNSGILLTHSYTNLSSTLIGFDYQNMYLTSSNGTLVMTGSNIVNLAATSIFLYGGSDITLSRGTNSIGIVGVNTILTGSTILNISSATISIIANEQYQYNSKYTQNGLTLSFSNIDTSISNTNSIIITGSQTAIYSSITQSAIANEKIFNYLTHSSIDIWNGGWITRIVDYKSLGSGSNQTVFKIPTFPGKGYVLSVKCFLQAVTVDERAYTAEMYGGFITQNSNTATQLPDSMAGANTTKVAKTSIGGGIVSADITSGASGVRITIDDGGLILYIAARVDYMLTGIS